MHICVTTTQRTLRECQNTVCVCCWPFTYIGWLALSSRITISAYALRKLKPFSESLQIEHMRMAIIINGEIFCYLCVLWLTVLLRCVLAGCFSNFSHIFRKLSCNSKNDLPSNTHRCRDSPMCHPACVLNTSLCSPFKVLCTNQYINVTNKNGDR